MARDDVTLAVDFTSYTRAPSRTRRRARGDMTAANDDVDEEALLYGDVGACATTTTTNGENSTRALNFEPARWIALRRARRDDARRWATKRTNAWVTDDDARAMDRARPRPRRRRGRAPSAGRARLGARAPLLPGRREARHPVWAKRVAPSRLCPYILLVTNCESNSTNWELKRKCEQKML